MNKRRMSLSLLPLLLCTLFLVAAPLLYVLVISFLQKGEYFGVSAVVTLENYRRMFSATYLEILLNSFSLGAGATAIALLIGYPFAYIMARQKKRLRSLLMLLIIIPFWTSALLRTYGWMILLRNKGLINGALTALGLIEKPIRMLNTRGAVLLGMAYSMLPFAILPIYGSIEKLDSSVREAARDLGAGPVRAFLTVTLPLTMPGVLSALVLTLVPSVGMFFISDLLGGGNGMLLGNLINNQMTVSRDWPFGAALSMLMVALTFAVMGVYRRVTGAGDLGVF